MVNLFTITLLEFFIGGGGRLFEVGPGTVGMILLAACLCAGLVAAICRNRKEEGIPLAIMLITAYFFVHITGILIGLCKGNSLDIAMVEMQLSLYLLAAPFLAVAYIGVVSALAIGMIDYPDLYTSLSVTEEFSFRSGGFVFYKGFLYLGISIIFLVAIQKIFSSVWGIIVVIALAMTLTRGLILSTAFAVLLLLIVQRRWRQLA